MPKISATYRVQFAYPVRMQADDADRVNVQARIDSFDVEVRINHPGMGPRTEKAGEPPVFFVKDFDVVISRDEDEEVPPIIPLEKGRDLTARMTWFSPRIDEHKKAAAQVANRVIRYFKYRHLAPRLQSLAESDNQFHNAAWCDAEGNPLETGNHAATVNFRSYEGPGLFGETAFTLAQQSDLEDAVAKDIEVSPAMEFFSEAQTVAKDGNFRRAVLEMAIACEVAIKHAFFESETPSAAAFAYLEDQRKVHISVIDLLDGSAKEAFSESFRELFADDYAHLENLFRCRNKIAHRAVAQYRDRQQIIHQLTRETFESWWQAVQRLFDWLEKVTGRTP